MVGRRYRREDDTVTVRDRDSMAQERVPIAELVPQLPQRITNWKRD